MKHGLIKVKYTDGLFGVKRYWFGIFLGYMSGDGQFCFKSDEHKLRYRFAEETADRLIDKGIEL